MLLLLAPEMSGKTWHLISPASCRTRRYDLQLFCPSLHIQDHSLRRASACYQTKEILGLKP
jgi:hypothetical protein